MITISSQPNYIARVYDTNTVVYKFRSTKYDETNFSFKIKVYSVELSGSTSTYITQMKLFSDEDGYVYFNPSSIINNLLSSDIDINSLQGECINSNIRYFIEVYEQYGDPITTYLSGVTDTKMFYNGVQIYENYDWLYNDGGSNNWFVCVSGITTTEGHFLTPTDSLYFDDNDYGFLYYLYYPEQKPPHVEYKFYDGGGSEISGYTYSLTYNYPNNHMGYIGIGPKNLLGGYTPVGWSYYTIRLINDTGGSVESDNVYSQTVTVYHKNKCSKYSYEQLFWLNDHGGYSNFTFNLKKVLESSINRTSYNKFLGYDYSTQSSLDAQRGTKNFNIDINEVITLNSDWINDEEVKLIKSLLYSADVRLLYEVIDYENGGYKRVLIPYVVEDVSFVEKNYKNDKMMNYTISIKKATQKTIRNS